MVNSSVSLYSGKAYVFVYNYVTVACYSFLWCYKSLISLVSYLGIMLLFFPDTDSDFWTENDG